MKKVLSFVMAVIMVVSVFSVSMTANAVETVSGSYNYLKNYIQTNGSKNSSGYKYISDVISMEEDGECVFTVTDDTKNNKLSFLAELKVNGMEEFEGFDGIKMTMDIKPSDTKYTGTVSLVYGIEIKCTGTFDPKNYDGNVEFKIVGIPLGEDDINLAINMCYLVAVGGWNSLLYSKTSITLGNFGFTKLFETKEIPYVPTVPATVKLSAISNTSDGVKVTWNAVEDADNYLVFRRTSSADKWAKLGEVTSTSYTDKTAVDGTTYYYTVRGVNAAGNGGYNNTGLSIKRLSTPDVTLSNATAGVNIKWTKINGADGYIVYKKGDDGKYKKLATVTGADTLSYQDTAVKDNSGVVYDYTVRAYSASSNGSYEGKTIMRFANPAVSVANIDEGINVKWNSITGAEGYYVYRKLGTGSYSKIAEVKDADTLSYVDTSIKDNDGVQYGYMVRAYKGDTLSSYAGKNMVRLSTPAVTLSNATGGMNIKWNKITGAEGYIVYRKNDAGKYVKLATLTGADTLSYQDTAVKNNSGVVYDYTVRAFKGSYNGSYVGNTLLRLANPTVTVANASAGMNVKWNKITGAEGYYVYRKTDSGSYSKIATITNGDTVSYQDTSVKSDNGVSYTYTVRAYNGSVMSSYAGKKNVRLTTISISSLTNSASKAMTVKYGSNAKASGYQIQYSTSSTFASGNKTTTSTSTSKAITGLTKGATYYVRVRAYRTVGGVNYYAGWTGTKSVKISK